ncbi:hypothetical protein CEXT_552341 [Caerostris extrusa]|uniref:Uncharacterized protein n=1 Tax=Caerostris extrusa TaxID=172846 RepID=A0AAV4NUF7_CAEEX|nr:hypothetical protein CEXT_552341 [Caerostris extrusa]
MSEVKEIAEQGPQKTNLPIVRSGHSEGSGPRQQSSKTRLVRCPLFDKEDVSNCSNHFFAEFAGSGDVFKWFRVVECIMDEVADSSADFEISSNFLKINSINLPIQVRNFVDLTDHIYLNV